MNAVAEIVVALDELAERGAFGVLDKAHGQRLQSADGGDDRRLVIADGGEGRHAGTALAERTHGR
jgi:hypothetical protein